MGKLHQRIQFVQNNPTMNIDPTGMLTWKEFKEGASQVYDKALDGAAAGLTYGKMVPGLGAGIQIGEALGGKQVDTNGNVTQLSGDQRVTAGLSGTASLALQLVAAGSPATTTLSVPGGVASQGGTLALQTATVAVPSATAVAGAVGVAVPAMAMGRGGDSGGGQKADRSQADPQRNGTPGNNQAQNKQFKDATRGLSKAEQRSLHEEITGQNHTYQELKAMAQEIINSRK